MRIRCSIKEAMDMLLSRCTGNYVHKQWIIWFYILFFIQNLREK